MDSREIDGRKKEDLLEEIRDTAASYVPEWQFDPEHPDVGTVLAMVYADLFAGTLRRFRQVLRKNEIAFFRELGAELLPAVPAKGTVTFHLSTGEFGGTQVPKGFALLGEPDEEEQSQVFETMDDLFVTPSALSAVLYENGPEVRIVEVFRSSPEQEEPEPFFLFAPEGKNEQEHLFFLSQDHVLRIRRDAWISLRLIPYRFGNPDGDELSFLEKEAVFEYYTEEGFLPFEEQKLEEGVIYLHKGAGQLPFAYREFTEAKGYFIRCRLEGKYNRKPIQVEDVWLAARAEGLAPDLIQTDEGEQAAKDIFPFGQRPSLFSEIYFASEEALSKKGARITLKFRLDFERFPLEIITEEQEREWKLVMKRSDFRPDPEYDITIEQVIFEYYNGTGWSRLFAGQEHSRTFSGKESAMGRMVSIEFPCPDDMEPVLLHSAESCYLRIRVIRMDNLYKIRGNYITPVISDVNFSYSYKGQGLRPERLICRNNRKTLVTEGKSFGTSRFFCTLFQGLENPAASLYWGFTEPLTDGPLRMFASMEETIHEKLPRLSLTYSGEQGFEPFSVVDETEDFRKSGLITFMGRNDFKKREVFGVEAYWLRLTDESGAYAGDWRNRPMPRIRRLSMNTVRVLAVETMPEEFFSVETGEENPVCRLRSGAVYDLSVWVNEAGSISREELDRLLSKCQAKTELDEDGEIRRAWVLWQETEDFWLSGPESRCYLVDRNQGVIRFGDGRRGALPPVAGAQEIRVSYRCGGGTGGNQRPGSVAQMSRSLGFLSGVANEERTEGGCQQETLSEALIRNSRRLRHGERAVTTADFEALVREADRNIVKVRCFPGRNEEGRREPGSVTAVVLPEGFRYGRADFDEVKERVLDYMNPRLPGNMAALGKFYVAEPYYVKLVCLVELSVRDFNQVFEVKERVKAKIEEFLDPVTGNYLGTGWDIGRLPNETQVMNAVKGIPGIAFLKRVRLSAYAGGREEEGGTGSGEPRRIYAVPVNGDHEIQIQVE